MVKRNVAVILSLCGIFCFPDSGLSQRISEKLNTNFSPSIIRRVYDDITSKISLSEATQFWLASAYVRQDSLINTLILNENIPVANIKRYEDSTNWVIESELKKVMSAEEKQSFITNIDAKRIFTPPVFKNRIAPDAEMNSQFGFGLKMQRKIGLTDNQGDSLLDYAEILRTKMDFNKANPDSGFFDKAAFESKYMSTILNENQYNAVLADKNFPSCETQAKYDWHDINLLGLAKKFNKDSTIKKLTIYYLLQAHITDRFANEKERRALMLKALKKPEALMALQEARKGNSAKLEKYIW